MRQVPDSSTAPRTSYCRDGQVPSPSWGWAPSWNEFSPPAFYATRTPSPEVVVSYPHPPLMPHSPRLTSSQLPGERESVWNNSNYSRATTGFYFAGTENVNGRTYGHMTSQMCNSERVEASGRTSGSETHEFESVLSIVMKQVNEEIRSTCDILGIHPNPCEWSMGDVRAWILWTSRQCGLNGIVLDLFNMDGATLSSLSPDGFRQRAPQGGDTLHAKLDIWRSAYQQTASTTTTCLSSVSSPTATVNSGRTNQDAYKQQVEVAVGNKQQQQTEEVFSIGQMLNWMNNTQDAYCSTTTLDSRQHFSLLNGPSQSCSFSCSSAVTHQQQQHQLQQQPMYAQQPTTSPYSEMNASESDAGTEDVTSADDIDDDDSLPEDEGVKGHRRSSNQNSSSSSSSGGGSGGGGSHIHLWQFLKELLAHPQENGTAIRWLDRQRGVFKIEDSVRVARLWGKRKNRPAMNYDKLSRSIRQYYRKGIMRKTERSQRLVYQFCHPYAL